MNAFVSLLLRVLAVAVTAYLVGGVTLAGWLPALVVAVVLGILNSVLKPILVVLTLPVNILTLGLFTLVINALLVLLAARIVPGFEVVSFAAAFWFGLVLSVVNWFLNRVG
ncbi:hypothetical protein A3H89_01390 [Candidatus Amesbacteria bacterium RIFCSPLOWO2_02_FULL_48_11]|uniref:Phage holin family protein n=2 Tax=Candidatus Amesiibacteriota TaxID=1752730 RepID=A0A1F4ZG98_9BACT|nr:MAG: hypothetical protein UY22_C0016G0012 [Candidatus Amesbacteria bacterium GW2011_GWC1_48_10]OGC90141.1 MAG: hypothetical protein A2V48_01050 [Candidatus Amesbacteria bacterium RBG_19FT_COMBO_48_16]OGC96434.1 MAG: hypothetical protein A3C34_02960 [Candidatus Amesbacteria bacterium RIFCSPHIGHO2_02_FULL_48_21]OGC98911.1 MAG: hypothetical protein A2702_03250 [Candidatus Amesbacteria bacterium RIFCSPHIGHO2_01_FULL_48_75]OGD01292.1 MAG: hypothetical protein A2354_03705 [Candidatus Amesbacteria 